MTARLAAWARTNDAAFFPVHPVYETVQGAKCYPSIQDVPGDIDLAVILTGRAVDTFEEVVARKAKFAVIFAAGFSEAGRDGEQLEARLERLVRSGDTRLLGPNTNLNAFEDFRDDLEGPAIALITQSGHQGRPVFQGQELGIRLTQWAPTGNEVDLEFADFARYFADQPEVGVIAAYIEGFKDGRTLMLAADHAARLHKPLVVVKVGRTDEGRSMAKAHTGHLTGSDAVVSAVFRQLGVTRVDGLDELLDTSAAFARTQPATPPKWGPKGPGACVYAVSGGTGAHMADMLSTAGLRLPPLTKATQDALHDGLIPAYLRVSNPVDCGGPPVADQRGREILDRVLADPNVDLLIVPITGAVEMFSKPLTRDLVEVAGTTDKPIFVVWGAPAGTDDTYPRRLLDGGLPVFRTFGNCVGAVRAYVDYWQFVRRYRSAFPTAPTAPSAAAARARRLLAAAEPGRALSEHASKAVLKLYGIRPSRDELCTTPAAAVRAARALGYPVVMKVSSPELLHKSDLGLVRVGVDSDRAVRTAFEELMRRRTKGSRPPRPDRGCARLRAALGRCRDGGRGLPGRAVRPGRDGRARRRVRRGPGRCHLPRAAVRPPGGGADAARARRVRDARRRPRREGGRCRCVRRRDHERAAPGDGPGEPGVRRAARRARCESGTGTAPRCGGPRCVGGTQVTEPEGTKVDVDVDQELLAEIRDHVLWLTINRPDAGNAITPALRNRMIEHLNDASGSFDVRAIVLTAAGEKHFCTGADLRTGRATPPPKPEGAPERPAGAAARMIKTGIQRLIGAFLDCEKPIVCALNGTAAGGGAAMVLASDLVIAAENARIIQVFVRRGLIPDGGGTYLLPRLVGLQKAKELVFFGDDLGAADAERIGLVNKVVPAGELTATATEWSARLANGPTKTIGFAKRLLNHSLDTDRATMFEEEALFVEMVTGTEDSKEGMASFIERSPTEFKGW